jgi:hypothetical protein
VIEFDGSLLKASMRYLLFCLVFCFCCFVVAVLGVSVVKVLVFCVVYCFVVAVM